MPTTFAPWSAVDRHDACTERSPDGILVVTVQQTPGGIFVERVIQRPGTARIVQAIVFATATAFHRWCDADVARFDYPLLYSRLSRDADELFARHAAAQVTG